jgi:hypothetical protein
VKISRQKKNSCSSDQIELQKAKKRSSNIAKLSPSAATCSSTSTRKEGKNTGLEHNKKKNAAVSHFHRNRLSHTAKEKEMKVK